MECLKLIASPQFYEKRIGYLGLSLLLTEQEEVLTLVTNSVQLDLKNPNPFVVGLALSAVGNLGTEDIARDLAMDIDKVCICLGAHGALCPEIDVMCGLYGVAAPAFQQQLLEEEGGVDDDPCIQESA